MRSLLARLATDDSGQDLVEYALLTAGVGLVAAATWPLITQAVGAAYGQFDTQTQDLWEIPPPAGGGS